MVVPWHWSPITLFSRLSGRNPLVYSNPILELKQVHALLGFMVEMLNSIDISLEQLCYVDNFYKAAMQLTKTNIVSDSLYMLHRQNDELKNADGKENVKGQNVEYVKRSTEKASKVKKRRKHKNVE
jgi:hypothetical protein